MRWGSKLISFSDLQGLGGLHSSMCVDRGLGGLLLGLSGRGGLGGLLSGLSGRSGLGGLLPLSGQRVRGGLGGRLPGGVGAKSCSSSGASSNGKSCALSSNHGQTMSEFGGPKLGLAVKFGGGTGGNAAGPRWWCGCCCHCVCGCCCCCCTQGASNAAPSNSRERQTRAPLAITCPPADGVNGNQPSQVNECGGSPSSSGGGGTAFDRMTASGKGPVVVGAGPVRGPVQALAPAFSTAMDRAASWGRCATRTGFSVTMLLATKMSCPSTTTPATQGLEASKP